MLRATSKLLDFHLDHFGPDDWEQRYNIDQLRATYESIFRHIPVKSRQSGRGKYYGQFTILVIECLDGETLVAFVNGKKSNTSLQSFMDEVKAWYTKSSAT